jgi:radical SAM superfamily enzyme YgiQ (UPF0313 family)
MTNMAQEYYIMHNPLTFNLMDCIESSFTPIDMISFLTGKDASQLGSDNFRDFLSLDPNKRRITMVETTGVESYAAQYVANQITNKEPNARVVLTDGKRRTLREVIDQRGKPKAVFLTSMSATFPTTVAQTIALNHGEIPVVLGGIHVSTNPDDVDVFIRKYIPNQELVSFVTGPGDSNVIEEVLNDISQSTLKPRYSGERTIQDGVWGSDRIEQMPSMRIDFLMKFPVLGKMIKDRFRINTTTPYLGCPYSCNFCSVSSLPINQRKFTSRDPKDFVNELIELQKDPVSLQNRYFFFLTENLLLGGKRLEEILDMIINSDLKLNYFAQISIEVADKDDLLKKLRLSGATHFFIGFESLNLQNLRHIGKHCTKAIERSGLSVADYYSQKIRKIQNRGISINGSFIFGLPYDYFNSLSDNSSKDVSQFCIDHNISLQPNCLTDLPGSKNFVESQANGNYLYGQQGSMKYLLSLSACDFSETNRIPPESLFQSPLLLAYMVYDATERVGSTINALKDALYNGIKAWQYPTKNGRANLRERIMDFETAAISQLGMSLYKEHVERLFSSGESRGVFERLFNQEKDSYVRQLFCDFESRFK